MKLWWRYCYRVMTFSFSLGGNTLHQITQIFLVSKTRHGLEGRSPRGPDQGTIVRILGPKWEYLWERGYGTHNRFFFAKKHFFYQNKFQQKSEYPFQIRLKLSIFVKIWSNKDRKTAFFMQFEWRKNKFKKIYFVCFPRFFLKFSSVICLLIFLLVTS